MSTNHNRIKVADLETNHPNKILKTNLDGKLEFSDAENNFQPNLTDENFGAFQNSLQTVNTIADTDKMPLLIGSLARMMTWANFKSLFKTVGGNSIFGSGNIATPDMDTTTTQTVSGVKTFLNLMLGLRNTANTFTSFITNAATASRTWTFPDKNGTVAMTSDITGVINAGTANRIPKYVGSTIVGNSRIQDTGIYIGVDTINTPTKDFTLGYQTNKIIGIEESDSLTEGRDFTIEAGRTINYSSGLFTSSTLIFAMKSIALDPNGDLYGYTHSGIFYKKSPESSTWALQDFTVPTYPGAVNSFAINNAGDMFIMSSGQIYKRTGRAGNFIPMGINADGLAASKINNDVYYFVNGLGVFKLVDGVGPGINQSVAAATYSAITVQYNNDVFIAVLFSSSGFKQTGGNGTFVNFPFPTTSHITSLASSPNGNLYTVQVDGTVRIFDGSSWSAIYNTVNSSYDNQLAVDINNDVYISSNSVTLYYQQNYAPGIPNLNGGTQKIKSGTGKGTGKSRVEFYTGQKTSPGTDMQVEKMRVCLDENGNFIYLTPPSYANDTDADADSNLPSKAFYKITGNRTLFQKP